MAAVGFNVENLEGRMLLSADAVLEHGTLRVHGIEDSPNTIVVGNSADGLSVNVSVSTLKKNGVTKTITASFPKTLGIDKVRINGGIRPTLSASIRRLPRLRSRRLSRAAAARM